MQYETLKSRTLPILFYFETEENSDIQIKTLESDTDKQTISSVQVFISMH